MVRTYSLLPNLVEGRYYQFSTDLQVKRGNYRGKILICMILHDYGVATVSVDLPPTVAQTKVVDKGNANVVLEAGTPH